MSEDPEYKAYWAKTWESDNAPWASPDTNAWLSKNDNLSHLTKGRQNLRIFVSLCGDSPDMKWFGDMGHTVIGADIAKEPLIKFFTKYNIDYAVEDAPACQGTLYKSKEDMYHLYCCNFFNFNSSVEPPVDAVFDIAAIATIHPDLRQKYAKIVGSLLKDDGVCIVERVEFTSKDWEGPPFLMPKDDFLGYFESDYSVKLVETYPYIQEWDPDAPPLIVDMFAITKHSSHQ